MTITIQKFGLEGKHSVVLNLTHGDERIAVEFTMSEWSRLIAHSKMTVAASKVTGNEKGGPKAA